MLTINIKVTILYPYYQDVRYVEGGLPRTEVPSRGVLGTEVKPFLRKYLRKKYIWQIGLV